MRAHGIGILIQATDIPPRGHALCGDALVHGALRIARMEAWTFAVLAHAINPHRHRSHHLDAARDHHVICACDHTLRGKIHRLLRRAAFAIERDGRYRFWKACREYRLTTDIARLLGDLDHAASDHILDQGGIQMRALDEPLQHLRIQIHRMKAGQCAVLTPASERGPHYLYDHGSTHGL